MPSHRKSPARLRQWWGREEASGEAGAERCACNERGDGVGAAAGYIKLASGGGAAASGLAESGDTGLGKPPVSLGAESWFGEWGA